MLEVKYVNGNVMAFKANTHIGNIPESEVLKLAEKITADRGESDGESNTESAEPKRVGRVKKTV